MLLRTPPIPKKYKPQLLRKRFWLAVSFSTIILILSYKIAQSRWTQPEAIFVLGGHEDRERLAAKLALKYPNLPIWISSGSPESYVQRIFVKAGVDPHRLHLNYQAKDTVTNFTTLVDQLKAQGIDSVYLITSDQHMKRARIIGEIVFGSRGIVIKPVSVPSHFPEEPTEKVFRDGLRAILWVFTGKSGETLLDNLHYSSFKLK